MLAQEQVSGAKRAASASASTFRSQLYFRVSSPLFGKTEWFSFNPSVDDICGGSKRKKEEEEEEEIRSKPELHDELNSYSSCAAVGSYIYIFGGRTSSMHEWDGVRDVYSLNTITGETSKRAPMGVGRSNPHTAVIDGKIYVMGGGAEMLIGLDGNSKFQGQWAEVYDPMLDKWEFLPPPPWVNICKQYMITAAVLHSGPKILLTQKTVLQIHVYDVKAQKWLLFDDFWSIVPHRHTLPFTGQAVAVNEVIYCWDFGRLYAYHLHRHTLVWTSAVRIGLLGKEYAALDDQPARLVHVDAHNFCLVWVNDGRLHCVMFEASLSISLGGYYYLKASVTSQFVRAVDLVFNQPMLC